VALQGLPATPDQTGEVDGHPRRAWTDGDGTVLIEQLSITGMAHGVPVAGGGEDPVGKAGAHMLDVGLSSTVAIAEFFGIASGAAASGQAAGPRLPAKAPPRPRADARAEPRPETRPEAAAASGPQAVIEKALRAAGLMR
jgi:poly(3-hydroxybutyrate) depolymerase